VTLYEGGRPAGREMLQQPESRIDVPRRLEARKNAAALKELLDALFTTGTVSFYGITVANIITNTGGGTSLFSGLHAVDLRADEILLGSPTVASATINFGTGSPETVLSAPVGSLYLRTDGGAGTVLYVKEGGGAGNTGWAAK
jgi:hypothetical protein